MTLARDVLLETLTWTRNRLHSLRSKKKLGYEKEIVQPELFCISADLVVKVTLAFPTFFENIKLSYLRIYSIWNSQNCFHIIKNLSLTAVYQIKTVSITNILTSIHLKIKERILHGLFLNSKHNKTLKLKSVNDEESRIGLRYHKQNWCYDLQK